MDKIKRRLVAQRRERKAESERQWGADDDASKNQNPKGAMGHWLSLIRSVLTLFPKAEGNCVNLLPLRASC